jgi:hypothetical protein
MEGELVHPASLAEWWDMARTQIFNKPAANLMVANKWWDMSKNGYKYVNMLRAHKT